MLYALDRCNPLLPVQKGSVWKNYEQIKWAVADGCVTFNEISEHTGLSDDSIKRAIKRYDEELYKKIFDGKSDKVKRNYKEIALAYMK